MLQGTTQGTYRSFQLTVLYARQPSFKGPGPGHSHRQRAALMLIHGFVCSARSHVPKDTADSPTGMALPNSYSKTTNNGVSLPLGVSNAPPSPGPASVYILLYIRATAATCSTAERCRDYTYAHDSQTGKKSARRLSHEQNNFTASGPSLWVLMKGHPGGSSVPPAPQSRGSTSARLRYSNGCYQAKLCNMTQKNPSILAVSDK